MSLQGLISGSECAVPFNPLSQVLKHAEGDRSLQQDRIAGPSSSKLHHLPSTSSALGAERDLALARQFFDPRTQTPNPGASFNAQVNFTPSQVTRMDQEIAKGWSDVNSIQNVMFRQEIGKPTTSGWASEFSSTSRVSPGPQQEQSISQRPDIHQRPFMDSNMYGGSMSFGMYNPNMPFLQSNDNGKGKGREFDLEAAFAQLDASFATAQTEGARIVEVDDVVSEPSESTLPQDLQETDNTSVKHNTDFNSVWDELQKSRTPPAHEDIAKWEAEFNQLMSSHREDGDYDYGEFMQNAFHDGLVDEFGNRLGQDADTIKFDDKGLPILEPYVFEPNNKYLDPSIAPRSPLREAKALLEQNGSLSEVALLLEAAIQQGELGTGGYEAWILLGETRSMDEREEAAMRALTEGVRRAEQAGASGEGVMPLAIAFTNEGMERASHTMLLRWLQARFPSYEIPQDAWDSLSQSTWHSHERAKEVFLDIARDQYSQGEIDPDVQMGLGVLFYTTTDYTRAKDCFETALTVRPKDYLLWNRMGSSLSNGNEPEKALGAYREALQLRPTYTRAIYNVGVACVNIGAHTEAAEHFLSALAMQETSGGTKSEHLWLTLRRTFVSMGRPDLADKANSSTNVGIFRQEGFDF
ncbi:Peroxisomal targeting signal receptor [Sparassis crispa]|uniref:Peroxisomal targeting signal receptor n=1 Tax=Sparassis crispa TaxID=139825 RepID=A0A401GG76_9APHY|nr:Peroxisomal targeting signal receptor [Sparassis crispa]GBE81169.1 Peroxisomal targeting signal receptor [Sparassis crispa]